MIEQILSYKTLFFNIIATISCAFSPVMSEKLYAILVKNNNKNENLYQQWWPAVATAETSYSLPQCANILCYVTMNIQQASVNVSGYHFIPYIGIHWHTFASYTLPCQMPFCQTALLLPSVAWQQNLTEYWWEGSTSAAIPPISAFDITGQHNKGGIMFRLALIC